MNRKSSRCMNFLLNRCLPYSSLCLVVLGEGCLCLVAGGSGSLCVVAKGQGYQGSGNQQGQTWRSAMRSWALRVTQVGGAGVRRYVWAWSSCGVGAATLDRPGWPINISHAVWQARAALLSHCSWSNVIACVSGGQRPSAPVASEISLSIRWLDHQQHSQQNNDTKNTRHLHGRPVYAITCAQWNALYLTISYLCSCTPVRIMRRIRAK